MPATALSQIGQIASMRRVHEAFQWLHLREQQIMRWQAELVAIAAPPFAEQARAAWLRNKFEELGREPGVDGPGVVATVDQAGNVLAGLTWRPTPGWLDPLGPPLFLVSAHIDTVFPAQTPLTPVLDGTRLEAPGACDNGAGVAALLALAAALLAAGLEPGCQIVFAGNVGEEGEGDLRGMRHIYASPWSRRIAGHLVLDGAGHEIAVTDALGSERFEVTIRGSGGHSWTDAGRPNPVVALGEAIAAMGRIERCAAIGPARPQLLPADRAGGPIVAEPLPRSSWNVGTIEGGSSVNAIPEQAIARFDLRSTHASTLAQMETELRDVVEQAVHSVSAAAEARGTAGHPLTFSIARIGSRPAGSLGAGARILDLLRGVDRHLGLRTDCRTASTDANIPLSLGVEAISIGAGGEGGGIHTRSEWYDGRGRVLGLKRVLLLLLALAARQQVVAAD